MFRFAQGHGYFGPHHYHCLGLGFDERLTDHLSEQRFRGERMTDRSRDDVLKRQINRLALLIPLSQRLPDD